MGLSDHRPIYVDLNSEMLFGANRKVTSKMNRFFTTKKKKALNNYLETLTELCERSKLFDKMEELKVDFERCHGNKSSLVEKLNKYDAVREQLMKAAQKNAVPFSGLNSGPLHWRVVVWPSEKLGRN